MLAASLAASRGKGHAPTHLSAPATPRWLTRRTAQTRRNHSGSPPLEKGLASHASHVGTPHPQDAQGHGPSTLAKR